MVRRVASATRRRGRAVGAWAGVVGRGTHRLLRRVRRSIVVRRVAITLALCVMSTIAAGIGIFVAGSTPVEIGPFRTTMSVQPSTVSESEIDIPPLGSLIFDSHSGPLRMEVRLDTLDQARTQELVTDPHGVEHATASVPDDVIGGVINTVLAALAGAVLAGLVVGGLVFRTMRRTALCGVLAMVVTVAGVAVAAATVRPQSITEPRYEGLLTNAPAVIGDAQNIADRYQKYRQQLQKFIVNMSQFYTIARNLPSFEPDPDTIRVLHVSDLHLNPAAWDVIESVVKQFQIDLVIDTGDMSDWGSKQEADFISDGLARIPVPYVYIRGNHDSQETAAEIAKHSNAIVLDNEVTEVAGLRIGGIGDPRFTPDKTSAPSDLREEQVMLNNGTELAETIVADGGADVALVHDPIAAGPLAPVVPLVLSGHKHQRLVSELDDDTLSMTQGSTGGAGLRGLDSGTPVPLEMSVLYFDSSHHNQLQAFDDITMGGHGQTNVTLQRHILTDGMPDDPTDLVPNPEEVDEEQAGEELSRQPDND